MGESVGLEEMCVSMNDLAVHSFIESDVDGVIRRANATEYGLASGVFTKDISKVSECVFLH